MEIPNPITYAPWYYSAGAFLFLAGASVIVALWFARRRGA